MKSKKIKDGSCRMAFPSLGIRRGKIYLFRFDKNDLIRSKKASYSQLFDFPHYEIPINNIKGLSKIKMRKINFIIIVFLVNVLHMVDTHHRC